MAESYGFLSTYPPTQCGLASFTASLASALGDGPRRPRVGIVRVVKRPDEFDRPEVVSQLVSTATGGEAAAAEALNRFDVAIIQHEFGIYGGRDGEKVIEIIRRLRVPSIVVLHTVLSDPTPHQLIVLEQVARAASAVVVMTATARQRLLEHYVIDPGKVALIAHGVPTEWVLADPVETRDLSSILTWGLIGPGKGLEWAIRALALLGDIEPQVQYTVVGQTHPEVLERHGESYRGMLVDLAAELGVSHMVCFDNRYLDRQALGQMVRAADVVLLPYDSTEQVTSGVLIEAVSARRPVVATRFSHAEELLSSGAGIVVSQRDPAAIAAAVRRIITVPGVAASMSAATVGLRPELTWASVGARYGELGERLRQDVASAVA